jgi:hypothetical protein
MQKNQLVTKMLELDLVVERRPLEVVEKVKK